MAYVDGFGIPIAKKKVMADPAMNDPEMMKSMPFDMKRFAMGGFKALVSFQA